MAVSTCRLLHQKARGLFLGRLTGVLRFLRKSYCWILGGVECEDRRAQLSRGVVIPGEIFHGCLVPRITLDCGIQSPIVCGAGIQRPGMVVEVMPVGATEEVLNC